MAAVETRARLLSLALMVRRDDGLREVCSTAERLAVSLLLNRHEWLDELGYTTIGAIDRLGWRVVSQLRQIECELAAHEKNPPGMAG